MLALNTLAKRIFGTTNDRRLKSFSARIPRINALEPEIAQLSDDELRARTARFREQVANGRKLDDLLPEAFATVREGAKRTLGQRHFDVQLIGGIVLHEGNIAEMKTGEGKTLVATLPVYLNALSGKGVHVVTVNDYLAKRDAEWMGQIYKFLGLSVGCIVHGLDDNQRRAQYACDVTYGTNNVYGFDYLRDNMKYAKAQMSQRGHNFAIVDEVDSILVDEARTPLIISGPTEDHSNLYKVIDAFMPEMLPEHFELDEKQRAISLTEEGNEAAEQWLAKNGMLSEGSLYDIGNVSLVHHVNQALRAHKLFAKDKDYIVKDDKVIIIDEFTGRMMEGRRYSEGLHQALEAKEGVAIQPENVTLASITFQNFFRLYSKLAGMTGTAATEANEFMDIYNLDVIEIPTNVAVARVDEDDEIYRTVEEKYDAIVETIEDCAKRGQPILVGTVSIEKSETLAAILKKKKIKHNVLNARYHEMEAQIISQAGVPAGVTIATNMAGRGTDIQLGGNADMRVAIETVGITDEAEKKRVTEKIRAEIAEAKKKVIEAGGLYVLGTERHESRRIDNQLRGRSGRQGDPGHSKFYLSLHDDLMRIFGQDKLDGMLQRLGLKQGEAISHGMVNAAIAKSQQRVEARNFDIRKNLLKFDNVMNDQRKTIFEQRLEFMGAESVHETVVGMRHQLIEDLVKRYIPEHSYSEQWKTTELQADVENFFGVNLPIAAWAKEDGIAEEEIVDRVIKAADERAEERLKNAPPDVVNQIERAVLLQTLDHEWREHLVTLDHLRQTIGLRGYAQRDPLNEYKAEAFLLFEQLLSTVRQQITRQLMHVQIQMEAPPQLEQQPLPQMHATHINPDTGENEIDDGAPVQRTVTNAPRMGGRPVPVSAGDPSTWGKVPRNALCPCGSGKKFKQCHGAL